MNTVTATSEQKSGDNNCRWAMLVGIGIFVLALAGIVSLMISAKRNADLDVIEKARGHFIRFNNVETFFDVWITRYWRGLADIEEVSLYGCRIDRDVMMSVSRIRELRVLTVENTNFDCGHLRLLRENRSLQSLYVRGTLIGDECVAELSEMKWLTELYLENSLLSDEAVQRIKSSLTNTKVDR
jgi:hypothetical protein